LPYKRLKISVKLYLGIIHSYHGNKTPSKTPTIMPTSIIRAKIKFLKVLSNGEVNTTIILNNLLVCVFPEDDLKRKVDTCRIKYYTNKTNVDRIVSY
jgi:hypothetical protein